MRAESTPEHADELCEARDAPQGPATQKVSLTNTPVEPECGGPQGGSSVVLVALSC